MHLIGKIENFTQKVSSINAQIVLQGAQILPNQRYGTDRFDIHRIKAIIK